MGRKKRQKQEVQLPWCYYCDKEFKEQSVLLKHQKQRHFTCQTCHKRSSTATSLVGHTWHMHQETLLAIPNAIPGRSDPPKSGGHDVLGMEGIPDDVEAPKVRRAKAEAAKENAVQEEAAARAAAQVRAEKAARKAAIDEERAKQEAIRKAERLEVMRKAEAESIAKRQADWQASGGGFSMAGDDRAKKLKTSAAAFGADEPSKSSGSGGWAAAATADEAPGWTAAPPEEDGGWGEVDDGASLAAVARAEQEKADAVFARAAEQAKAADHAPVGRLKGKIKAFNPAKGFGWVTYDAPSKKGGTAPEDIYLHRSGLVTHGLGDAVAGQEVSFTLVVQGDGRKIASEVRDRDGKPVDELLKKKQESAEKHDQMDRVDLEYGSDTFTGRKDNGNEDRFMNAMETGTAGHFDKEFGKWFGVYDGHNGSEMSEFAVEWLYRNIMARWEKRGKPTMAGYKTERLKACIEESFKQTDEEFLASRGNIAGSTAIAVLVHGRDPPPRPSPKDRRLPKEPPSPLHLVTCNLGDSRAVLCRGGRAIPLSEDHKPNRRDEKARVERCGGAVVNIQGIWRVCTGARGSGTSLARDDNLYLAVSRAFGDPQLKMATPPVVSMIPEITTEKVKPEDMFFLIACDGIWDVMTDQEAIDIAAARLIKEGPKAAAAAVVREAYRKKSFDNLTVTVVQFGWQTTARMQRYLEVYQMEKAQEKKAKKKALDEDEEIDMFA